MAPRLRADLVARIPRIDSLDRTVNGDLVAADQGATTTSTAWAVVDRPGRQGDLPEGPSDAGGAAGT